MKNFFALYLFILLWCSSSKSYAQWVVINQQTSSSHVEMLGNASLEKGDAFRVKVVENKDGIRFKGNWDFRIYDQMELTLVNHANKKLKLAVRLENEGEGNVFRDYIYLSPQESRVAVMSIPRQTLHPEVEKKLFGMHIHPLKDLTDKWSKSAILNLDPEKVIALSVYQEGEIIKGDFSIQQVKMVNNGRYDVPVWATLGESEFFPFVDKYGQFKFKNWPGKVYSDNDLKANLEKEEKELAAQPGPDNWSKYGGWKNGPRQEAKGHFYVKKINGKWWMVDPEGYLFWSHGVVRVTPSCGITPLDDRKFYFEGLPDEADAEFGLFYTLHDELLRPYYTKRNKKEIYNFSASNIKRKYGEDWQNKYAEMAHKRLKSWGLNTIANSSDKYIYSMDKTPYCDRFEVKSPIIEGASGTAWWWDFRDPFHPEFKANVKKQLLERKKEIDDPWCYGFFVDNELNWGGKYTLAFWTLNSSASQPAKKEFQRQMKKKYKTIQALNEQWKSDYKDWNDFLNRKEEPGEGAYTDCRAFSQNVIESYFKNINEVFKKYAPKKLYMGCRFAGYREDIIRLAAKHCDVISYNIYNKTLDWFKLPEGVDKPVMIGEFHFGALDRGLFHPSLIQVADQKARGEAYMTYVKSALNHPNMIGTHWHQFSDQMVTGRFDGECFQVGFTDICDTPYPETIEKIQEVGYQMYEIRYGEK